MHHPGKFAEQPMYGNRRAELDLWIGRLLFLFEFSEQGSHFLWTSVVVGRFLLSGSPCYRQIGHRGFEQDKDKSLGSFATGTGSERASFYACLGSHRLAFWPK